MGYPVAITKIEFVISRLCNRLMVYDKSNNNIFDTHDLRVKVGGSMVSKFFYVTVNNNNLTVSPQTTAPGTGWTSIIFTSNFADMTLPHLHAVWTDDDGAPKIVVGTGDTRDIVNTASLFDLGAGIVISSPADDKLIIYYQTGTMTTITL